MKPIPVIAIAWHIFKHVSAGLIVIGTAAMRKQPPPAANEAAPTTASWPGVTA